MSGTSIIAQIFIPLSHVILHRDIASQDIQRRMYLVQNY